MIYPILQAGHNSNIDRTLLPIPVARQGRLRHTAAVGEVSKKKRIRKSWMTAALLFVDGQNPDSGHFFENLARQFTLQCTRHAHHHRAMPQPTK
jgi:hypothetical protein